MGVGFCAISLKWRDMTVSPLDRKMLAILAADVVGYSKAMDSFLRACALREARIEMAALRKLLKQFSRNSEG
jgi:hypothetical protein